MHVEIIMIDDVIYCMWIIRLHVDSKIDEWSWFICVLKQVSHRRWVIMIYWRWMIKIFHKIYCRWMIEIYCKTSDHDLLKMNDSNYWRWMIEIFHKIYCEVNDSNYWRWMIKIYWRWMIKIFHKIYLCWRPVDEWFKLLKMND